MNEHDARLNALIQLVQRRLAAIDGDILSQSAEIQSLSEAVLPLLKAQGFSEAQITKKIENRRREIHAQLLADYEKANPGLAGLMDTRSLDEILPDE